MPEIAAYARIAGIVLPGVAAVGSTGWGWYAAWALYHMGWGILFLYVGFSRLEVATVRQIGGGMSVLLVSVIRAAILVSWLLPTSILHGPIEITSLVLGVASILAARDLPDDLVDKASRPHGR
jgi:hypothetical protein